MSAESCVVVWDTLGKRPLYICLDTGHVRWTPFYAPSKATDGEGKPKRQFYAHRFSGYREAKKFIQRFCGQLRVEPFI